MHLRTDVQMMGTLKKANLEILKVINILEVINIPNAKGQPFLLSFFRPVRDCFITCNYCYSCNVSTVRCLMLLPVHVVFEATLA